MRAPDNLRSRRALEKIGASPDGTHPGASGHATLRYRLRRADRRPPGAATA
ncbi:hypothetical protein [Catenuloplanes atrovinosus]|uniref:hypothetical protein n=1 Tax=Catenuloplanes atrovinosus TaxID=137266 RepID=UPI00286CC33A|nr:hypothetical protein [Catenuloplanes atrovinosus]